MYGVVNVQVYVGLGVTELQCSTPKTVHVSGGTLKIVVVGGEVGHKHNNQCSLPTKRKTVRRRLSSVSLSSFFFKNEEGSKGNDRSLCFISVYRHYSKDSENRTCQRGCYFNTSYCAIMTFLPTWFASVLADVRASDGGIQRHPLRVGKRRHRALHRGRRYRVHRGCRHGECLDEARTASVGVKRGRLFFIIRYK